MKWLQWVGFLLGMVFLGTFLKQIPKSWLQRSEKQVLVHFWNGPIFDVRPWIQEVQTFLEENSQVQAVVIQMESPGGAVGPSQELQMFFERLQKKGYPVIIHSPSLLASGAYYAALGASAIVVQPGTLVGSIGVIMEFINLEKLYEWAKIERFSLTSGPFKDAGAHWRPMKPAEREYFLTLIQDVHHQFLEAVKTKRPAIQTPTALGDGRVWTGSQAQKVGLVDHLGDLSTAIELAQQQAKMPLKPVQIPESQGWIWRLILKPLEGVLGKGLKIFNPTPLASTPGLQIISLPLWMDPRWITFP